MHLRRLVAVGILVVAALIGAFGAGHAVEPDEVLDDPALETRARALSADLRCMVCQNQSIDSSDAPLAKDLRVLVRERLVAGDSDTEVIDYLVARYGEFVLLKPRVTTSTTLLWATPILVLVAGVAFIVLARRGRRTAASTATPALTAEEEAELQSVIGARADRD